MSENKTKGQPIWLNIEEDESAINIDLSSKYKKTEKLFPYRNPKMVKLSVQQNDELLLNTRLPIAQFGVINYLPFDFLKKTEIKINPKTGNISNFEKEPKLSK